MPCLLTRCRNVFCINSPEETSALHRWPVLAGPCPDHPHELVVVRPTIFHLAAARSVERAPQSLGKLLCGRLDPPLILSVIHPYDSLERIFLPRSALLVAQEPENLAPIADGSADKAKLTRRAALLDFAARGTIRSLGALRRRDSGRHAQGPAPAVIKSTAAGALNDSFGR